MNRWKLGAAAALLIGLALTVGMVLYVGVGSLAKAVATVGWGGFLIFGGYSLTVFVPLGLAWWIVAPGQAFRRAGVFVWGRVVREAAADVLPFSQVGGLVVGVRAVGRAGVGEALAVASQIVDLTTEMAAQLFYTLFGVAMLIATLAHVTAAKNLIWTAGLALLVGTAMLGLFVALQGRGVDFAGLLISRWLKDTRDRADAVRAALRAIYAQPLRLGGGFVLHAIAWIASGIGSWLALRFMGVDLPLWKVLTMESLISALRSVAFMTPGGLGFQEGAYVLAAPLFGLTAESALALSLLKRAKDLAIGVPALLIWQATEGRKLLSKGVSTDGGTAAS
jgi:putative membrane protein